VTGVVATCGFRTYITCTRTPVSGGANASETGRSALRASLVGRRFRTENIVVSFDERGRVKSETLEMTNNGKRFPRVFALRGTTDRRVKLVLLFPARSEKTTRRPQHGLVSAILAATHQGQQRLFLRQRFPGRMISLRGHLLGRRTCLLVLT